VVGIGLELEKADYEKLELLEMWFEESHVVWLALQSVACVVEM
jgi:hypothetical protein